MTKDRLVELYEKREKSKGREILIMLASLVDSRYVLEKNYEVIIDMNKSYLRDWEIVHPKEWKRLERAAAAGRDLRPLHLAGGGAGGQGLPVRPTQARVLAVQDPGRAKRTGTVGPFRKRRRTSLEISRHVPGRLRQRNGVSV